MASAADWEAEIKKLTKTSELVSFWDSSKKKTLPKIWGGKKSGKGFEYLVVRAFEIEGLEVKYPYNIAIPQAKGTFEQVDGIVRLGSTTFIIESKDHASAVDIGPVAKLRLRLAGRPSGTMGIVFSTSDFTAQTDMICQFLQPLDVLLWGRSDFENALTKGEMKVSLEKKLQVAIHDGWPNWPVK